MKSFHLKLRLLFSVSCIALFTLSSPIAQAQYPDKPITFVSPFAAGGANDFLTRMMAQQMAPILKTTIVADNKTGANGIVGATFVAKSAPDGYTLLMGNSATQGTNPTLYPNAPYDAINDFAPVSMVGFVPLVLVIDPKLGLNTIAELVAFGKKNPGKLAFSSSGIGSTGHLTGEAFKMATGIDMVHAPYKGDAPAIADVAAGQVAITFVGVASASALYRAGRVKVLGVASAKRSSTMPDVPTLTEAGYKLEVSQWFALFARAGTPQPIIDQLNAAAKIVLEKPEVREAIIKQGAEPEYATPQQLNTFFRAEIQRFGDIIRRLDIKVN